MSRLLRLSPIVFILLVAACGTVAIPVWSEQAQGTQAALAVTSDYETSIAPTATPMPPTATPTTAPPTTTARATAAPSTQASTATSIPPTETPAPAVASGGVAGDPEHGKEIFNTFYDPVSFSCATCHLAISEERLIGPGLLNIADKAGSYVPGQTAEQYIHESIVNPSAYVVPDYPDGLMPQVWGDILSEQDIQDLVAYLFTLKG
jgi:mono/diheme cytochrome c family protein